MEYLLVIHDAELDRTTDAVRKWRRKRIKVESRTAAEIGSLDAGNWFHPRYAGTRVPLLVETLEYIGNRSVALIERKTGDELTCARLLREKKLVNHVLVQSFDWAYLRALHEELPEQVLGALDRPADSWMARSPGACGGGSARRGWTDWRQLARRWWFGAAPYQRRR